ncbi:hypothetical protein O3G_MSEX002652 [Manduca sexta]|uniref:RDH13 n=1 Tax=Manduca sexta TaxID=7130 RepID=A0A921YP54_MANSE|nr:hypothetical protein O3G_MSEX002652 [Manduca sexta]
MWFIWILLILIFIKVYNKITSGKCYSDAVLTGKVVIVTGGSNGLGFETALDLARRGATTILGCRDEIRGQKAVRRIIKRTNNPRVSFIRLDLSSLASVREFVKEFKSLGIKLDILINNAGVIGPSMEITEDGIVKDLQINHFGPFLLTVLLVPLLKKSAPSRIIIVSSHLHKYGRINEVNTPRNYLQSFCNGKLCNVLFSNELARRLAETGVVVNSLHPGQVNTSFYRGTVLEKLRTLILYTFFKSPADGSQTSVYLATSDECDMITGSYFADCKEQEMGKKANSYELALKVWSLSEELVKLQPEEMI